MAFCIAQCSGQKAGFALGCLITKEVFCNLGSEIWVSYCNLSLKGTVFSPSRVSQLVYPKLNAASVRQQEEFLSTVLLCFLFKWVVETHFQFLLQVCCTLTVNMIFISLGFIFNPCLQHPSFPSVLCWGGKGALAGEGEVGTPSRLVWENLNSRASPAQALQTETWSWRESQQGRSMRLTLLVKHPKPAVLLF